MAGGLFWRELCCEGKYALTDSGEILFASVCALCPRCLCGTFLPPRVGIDFRLGTVAQFPFLDRFTSISNRAADQDISDVDRDDPDMNEDDQNPPEVRIAVEASRCLGEEPCNTYPQGYTENSDGEPDALLEIDYVILKRTLVKPVHRVRVDEIPVKIMLDEIYHRVIYFTLKSDIMLKSYDPNRPPTPDSPNVPVAFPKVPGGSQMCREVPNVPGASQRAGSFQLSGDTKINKPQSTQCPPQRMMICSESHPPDSLSTFAEATVDKAIAVRTKAPPLGAYASRLHIAVSSITGYI